LHLNRYIFVLSDYFVIHWGGTSRDDLSHLFFSLPWTTAAVPAVRPAWGGRKAECHENGSFVDKVIPETACAEMQTRRLREAYFGENDASGESFLFPGTLFSAKAVPFSSR